MKMFCFLLLITALSGCLQALFDGISIAKKSTKLSPEEVTTFKEFTKLGLKLFDKDKDGEIDKKDFEEHLLAIRNNETDEASIKKELADFFRTADKNNDGKVNVNELYQFYMREVDAKE